MNKALSIQRSKLNTSYGGVGSIIDTIDNLSYQVKPFDEWNLDKQFSDSKARKKVEYLIYDEPRLLERLKNIGFGQLREFYQAEIFDGEDIKEWELTQSQKKRMVTSSYFPEIFYCPQCKKIQNINQWRNDWKYDANWSKRLPKCNHCSKVTKGKAYGPNLVQVRFVLASMETGKLRDIPWGQLYDKKEKSDKLPPSVWDFTLPIDEKSVTFHITQGNNDLTSIYVKTDGGIIMTMATVMNHYFLFEENGKEVVYRPVVKSANNVYFSYSINSIFIPLPDLHKLSPTILDIIKGNVENDDMTPKQIKSLLRQYKGIKLSEEEIRSLIDNNYVVPKLDYSSEEKFRLEEFNCLTNPENYESGEYSDDEKRLISIQYNWSKTSQINFVKQAYLLKRINVTSAHVAYSRIDKISINDLGKWCGKSDNPKVWYNAETQQIDKTVDVALHPTCKGPKEHIVRMPVVSAFGEGFFIEFNTDALPKEDKDREVFVHTYAHLVMKAIEYSCGYPLASMTERLYILPRTSTGANEDKYGFMIYCTNGEAGSYGGIATLFENGNIEKIMLQAIDLAADCPNDPICEDEGGSCFACVQVPETACEKFNTRLSRNVFNHHTPTLSSTGMCATSRPSTVNVSPAPSSTVGGATPAPTNSEDTEEEIILG